MADAPARLVEALSDRYRIERELGAGGMATVYLARDLKHDRQVAIKVLRSDVASALGEERFLREITTTANLRHPHILPLYDSGAADGFLYYVMPFVEGRSLRERMDRERQLPLDEALRLADQISDALEYAHGRGIVHRDIKPENILLEDGRAVVADFGLAATLTAATDERLTATGMSLGTPRYMSPEQAAGEPVDARSDLYSLGCLVFEMLAGEPPFTGPSAMAIIARHLMDPAPNLSTVRANLPGTVAAAVGRSLAKVPGDRFPSMTDWRAALRTGSAGAGAGTGSVAVEPEPIHKAPPAPPTELLGREVQVADAVRQLHEGARVLTVTGVGGTGKTRFAIELFHRVGPACTGGAAFVSLASITSPEEVMPVIATTLDIAEALGRSALDAIASVVGDRHVLLVVDNFEQVVDAAEDVAALVARCPGLQLVVTSRRPLKIGAEVELALPPLELPPAGNTDVARLLACPSVALFVERARKVKPQFALSSENASAVTGICRALDGLPLALELAAARVRVLDPATLLQRLDHALDLLSSGDRDLPLRQRTLRATISWSYSLLSAEEQRLLRRLSTFHEGWTFEAMEQVCYSADDRWRALDEFESLVEKGLVRVIGSGERYALLETIRAFAAEQLHAGAEVEAARDAHATYFLDFARTVHEGIEGTTQVASMDQARTEKANTFAALGWLIARARIGDEADVAAALRLCGWLTWYWHIAGLHIVAHDSVDTLLELATQRNLGPSLDRALGFFASGTVSASTGDLQRAARDWERMAADGETIGNPNIATWGYVGHGYALMGMGRLAEAGTVLDRATDVGDRGANDFLRGIAKTIAGMQRYASGDVDGGVALVEAARRLQIPLDDCEGGGIALSFLASMTFALGDMTGALALYRQAEETFVRLGDKPEIARVQCESGYVALAGDRVEEALRCFLRALRTYDEVGSLRGTGQALMGLAAAEAAQGNAERAVAIAAAAEVMSSRAGVVIEHPLAPGLAERIAALRATVPRAELEALLASGSAMSPSEVLVMVAASAS